MRVSCSPGRGSLGELEDELDDALDPTTGGGSEDQENESTEDEPGGTDDGDEE